MNETHDTNKLTKSISRFYDDYHRGRPRTASQWILTHYWPSFVGRTLEVGGGTLYPDLPQYYVSEISAEAARRAVSKTIPAVIADGGKLPFRNHTFDTVACHDVLEHIATPDAFMTELCRVAKRRVVIAGPNYVGVEPGHLDRRLIRNIYLYLTGNGRTVHHLQNPHLMFDADWVPDKDAVTAANGGWVADQMQQQGLQIRYLRTWEYNHHWLNAIPVLRCLGPFMFVVGERVE